MRSRYWLTALLAAATGGFGSPARAADGVNFVVREEAGIRRFNYPVNAQCPIARGKLHALNNLRLVLEHQEVPMQATIVARWPDDSIRRLELDFNASIAPLAAQRYRLEYGDGVHAQDIHGEHLIVNETAEALEVGRLRFGKKASPLPLSVAYRQQVVGNGVNAFTIVDGSGETHELSGDDLTGPEIVKAGPLVVLLRYEGKLQLVDGYAAPFTISAEMPVSKSWIRYSASVDDPGKRIREIAFNSSLALGAYPWTWDFGTGSWSYGAFRSPGDSAVLTQVVTTSGSKDWQIHTGASGREQLYERAAGKRPAVAEGWGHLQGSTEVVAFAFEHFGRQRGTYTMALDSQGQAAFRFAPARPSTRHQIAVYQHFVASPTPVGAATSPASMLHGLTTTIETN